jgi:amyloid beta precursor protein binding protein 1
VLVLGSGSAATETLKNLVLPGVGRFLVVDDAKVSRRDIGQNFFVREEKIGTPRCECVTNCLLELNPDV